MELIDKAALMKYPIRINHYDKEHGNKHFVLGIESVLEFAEQLPLIDAVEVVRCCDCKYSVVPCVDSEGNVVCLYCQHPRRDDDGLSMTVDFVDFCSQGKRRESDTVIAAADEIKRLQKELDAAVQDLAAFGHNAHTCAKKQSEDCKDRPHDSCYDCPDWQWRGREGSEARHE